MKFPRVPAIKNAVMNRLIFFIMNNRMNAPIPSMLIVKMMMNGMGNDQEIPVLNAGEISDVWSRYIRL